MREAAGGCPHREGGTQLPGPVVEPRSSKHKEEDLPAGPGAKTPCSQSRGPRFNPCSGN